MEPGWNSVPFGTIAGGTLFSTAISPRSAPMSAVAVRAMFRSHPEKPAHAETISRCIDSCFNCVETCPACADACLAERDIEHLVACVRLNLDCAAVCSATGNIMARANKAGHRQLARGAAGELHRVLSRLRDRMRPPCRPAPALSGVRRGLRGVRRGLQRHAQCDADADLSDGQVEPAFARVPCSASRRSTGCRRRAPGTPARPPTAGSRTPSHRWSRRSPWRR